MRLVVSCVADLPPDGVLVIHMRRALALQPGDLALQPRLPHQPAVARCDRLGHRELVGLAAGILQAADGAMTGQRRLMNRALRSLFCHMVASIEPSVA